MPEVLLKWRRDGSVLTEILQVDGQFQDHFSEEIDECWCGKLTGSTRRNPFYIYFSNVKVLSNALEFTIAGQVFSLTVSGNARLCLEVVHMRKFFS